MKMSAITAGVLLGLSAALALPAGAVTISASNTTATISTAHTVTVAIATEGTTVDGFLFDLQYDSTLVSLPPFPGPGLPAHVTTTGTGAADLICNDFGPAPFTVFRCIATTPITSPTFQVHIAFNVGATAAPAPGMPLTFGPATVYVTDGGLSEPPFETVTPGSITIVTGPPPDVVVTFTPASGSTVAFGGGLPGANVTQSIAIGNTGTIGTGTVSGCVISGPDAASFSITGGNPSTVPPATSLGLQATLGAAALNATLTCNVADSSPTTSATWTLTAPAGTVLQAPTLAANPASGTAITLPNSYGTPVSSNIVITPTGGDAGGPDASVACTATAGFTVTAATLTFTPPGGAAQNAVVGCTPGAAAVSGTVSCGGTDQAGVINWSWPVTCPAAQTAPPPPTFVPASSLWSKLALFGVFAALGMLILGLRRNH
ncbi:MAG: hypothetical protein AB7D30_04680 [Lysobacteraceae bacterium]